MTDTIIHAFADSPLGYRMEVKRLIRITREKYPDFEFLGEVDEVDTTIEALIHPETFELMVRAK